ncbi:MAG: tyrosinase family protein [Gammaproteobacteria bacterium]
MKHTRRDFMLTASTGIVAGLLLTRSGFALDAPYKSGAKLKVRKNVVSSDAAADLKSLKAGVAAMKKLAKDSPNDGRGWIKQAFIHGDCDRFTKCQHGNWYFAPWHRSFIYYFEELVRFYSKDESFALPYWDWSRTHSVPGSFYGSGNPLDDDVSIRDICRGAPTAGRGRAAGDQFSQADLDTFVGPAVINGIQQNPDFATYGGANPGAGALERTPHNFIHRWVGGTKFSNMVQTFSPLDPIFWMHHCNIDRLYSNWLARSKHNPPPEAAWQKKSFNDFYDRNGNQAGSQFTCGMTVDSTVMGYVYDQALDLPMALAAAGARARVPTTPKVLETLAATEAKVSAGVLSFLAKAPTRNSRQLMNAAVSGAERYVVRLRIEGVKTPARQNTGVHVFIGSGITPETPISAPGYVGSFTFFDGERTEGGHDHASRTVLLDATEALQELYGDTSLPEGQNLTVSIVTRPLYRGVEAFGSVEEVKPASIHFDMVEL